MNWCERIGPNEFCFPYVFPSQDGVCWFYIAHRIIDLADSLNGVLSQQIHAVLHRSPRTQMRLFKIHFLDCSPTLLEHPVLVAVLIQSRHFFDMLRFLQYESQSTTKLAGFWIEECSDLSPILLSASATISRTTFVPTMPCVIARSRTGQEDRVSVG